MVSGKGGVGKSSVTVNLAAALAAAGYKVGLVDADVYGHSVPRMLGVTGLPTKVEKMIMPPSSHGVKVISMAMFKPPGNLPIVWRGPMLGKAMQQFLADVYWGDLDYLLLDLPPGTGDVAISLAQLLPNAELLVVTTPQIAAAEVAERAGSIVAQTRQRIVGVIENMSYLLCPHCGEQMDVFGSGGGEAVAAALTDAHRGPGAAARPGAAGRQAPRGRRQRDAAGAGRPVRAGRAAADQGRRVAGEQGPRPGGPDAEPQPELSEDARDPGHPRGGPDPEAHRQVASKSNGGSSPSLMAPVALAPVAVAVLLAGRPRPSPARWRCQWWP